MSNLTLKTQPLCSLEILSGIEKGKCFKLIGREVSIGRSRKNDISLLHDESCSRKHAILKIDFNNHAFISVNDDHKTLKLNGQIVKGGRVRHGDKIEIGKTKLLFQSSMALEEKKTSASKIQRKGILKKKHGMFYAVIGIVVFLFLFLFSGGEEKKKNLKIRTDSEIKKIVLENKKIFEKLKEIKKEKGQLSKEYQRSQALFLSGLRDYKNQLFEKAVDYFYACLSIFPDHPLCKRYLSTTRKRLSEKIQGFMKKGQWHKENQQYKKCYQSYFQAMNLIKDNKKQLYREAESGAHYCKFLTKNIY